MTKVTGEAEPPRDAFPGGARERGYNAILFSSCLHTNNLCRDATPNGKALRLGAVAYGGASAEDGFPVAGIWRRKPSFRTGLTSRRGAGNPPHARWLKFRVSTQPKIPTVSALT